MVHCRCCQLCNGSGWETDIKSPCWVAWFWSYFQFYMVSLSFSFTSFVTLFIGLGYVISPFLRLTNERSVGPMGFGPSLVPTGTGAVRCTLRFVCSRWNSCARILKCIGRLPCPLDLKVGPKPIGPTLHSWQTNSAIATLNHPYHVPKKVE